MNEELKQTQELLETLTEFNELLIQVQDYSLGVCIDEEKRKEFILDSIKGTPLEGILYDLDKEGSND